EIAIANQMIAARIVKDMKRGTTLDATATPVGAVIATTIATGTTTAATEMAATAAGTAKGTNKAGRKGNRVGGNTGAREPRTGHSFRPTQGDNYKNAPGYSSSMGDRQQYKDAYRQSYQQGYPQGYR